MRKPKNRKTIWIIFLLFLIIFTFLINEYFVLKKQIILQKNQNIKYEFEIKELRSKISDFEHEVFDYSIDVYPVDSNFGKDILLVFPAISDESKKLLLSRFINPVIDYYTENEFKLLGIIVFKIQGGDEFDYLIQIKAINNSEGHLYSIKNGEYWHPDCAGEKCNFSDSFKSKYPEIVK